MEFENNSMENNIENLINELSGVLSSMPRSLSFGSTAQGVFKSSSRDSEYLERHEIYRDSFTREMVKVIIVRAIGAEHNNSIPYSITLKNDNGINENAKELIKSELEYIRNITKKDIFSITMDSQFYGDGYSSLKTEEGVGITKIIYNFSTKPFNVTPYMTNHDELVACEVSPNMGLHRTVTRSLKVSKNGRRYAKPTEIARMNAKENGILELQSTNISQIENMNAFDDNVSIYEDFVYGGVVEGCVESFQNFKWAINSLANMRISSSIIERWIIHNLSGTSENERKVLKEALEKKIEATRDKLKEKVNTKDTTANIITHTVPTMTENTNGVEIQESNIQFNQQIDDIMIHIKRYIADIGFSLELTPYGSSQVGGGERDGAFQNSLQMEVQGEQIRGAIKEYLLHIVKVHFFKKYGQKINESLVEINFNSTINKAKIDAETQRMESVGNVQQISGLLSELREAGYEDTEESRYMLSAMLSDVISNTTEDKQKSLDAMLSFIFSQKKQGDESQL